MSSNIHFTPQDILRKDFKQKMRGYDPTDVDSFLDMIIRDYETFNKTINQLHDENDQLRDKVDQLSKTRARDAEHSRVARMSDRQQQSEDQPSQSTNATFNDLVKRVDALEIQAFGHVQK